ncbi:YjgN family protein [Blastomonas marina]|uniref:YjgN family protein n=1 Tax=Blastomonas marina TaxID=1867408 RepID=UPI002AC9D2BD|nr:YjgN family protein [Blastomonas marina]WPZ03702.1 YjgN family protein [Blastomonas marina]
MDEQDAGGHSAFRFHGTWREFAAIAFPNLLLTIVTLGVYRFWAKTRERKYLWGRTQFIDERLEWTGTGLELFFGFLLVLVLFFGPYFFVSLVLNRLVFDNQPGLAGALLLGVFVLTFYLGGVALFRALRYRMGRTYWHGIRGGSDDRGWSYGWSYVWKWAVGYLVLGLLVPWAMIQLWNERWNQMSFGPFRFRAEGDAGDLMKRYLLFYAAPFVFFAAALVFGILMAASGIAEGDSDVVTAGAVIGFVLFFLGFYALIGFIALFYYAKYFRVAISGLSLENLDFRFDASTQDWFKLFLVDILLVVGTLGIGWIFLTYRHWKFFVTHMEAYGEIDLDRLTQSDTQRSKHGEGLLDAFDMGAF